DNDVDDLSPPRANGVAQAVLEAFFIDKGVQLMDRGASQETRNRDIALAALKDDIKKLAAMAASFKADVVIRGSVEARRSGTSEMAGRTIYMWRATLNVRAYHTDSAQMLMSRTYSTTKATVNQNGGGDEAIRKCVEDHAGAILREVAEGWRKRQNVRRTCQLTLENCSRGDYKAFEKALREVDGVQEVRLRELVSEVCQVEVDWSYDLERLVSRIEKLHVSGMTFVITEQTHDRATVKLVKKSP
ncbi:MAG: hypothetical protein ACE5F9_15835, partial [Phycisphaerae bacterium]